MFFVVDVVAVLLMEKSRYVVLLVNSPSCICRGFREEIANCLRMLTENYETVKRFCGNAI